MDINSLLSPQDSGSQSARSTPGHASTSVPTASAPRPNKSSPRKNLRRGGAAATASSSSTKSPITPSPLVQQVLAPSLRADRSPASVSPPVGPMRADGHNGAQSRADSRQPSSTGMDTLADLASMQPHQPQRATPGLLRGSENFESQLSPSTMYPHVNQVSHNTPTSRSSFDRAMAPEGGTRDSARRNYVATSLDRDAQRQATELFARIQENPHSYDAHVQFIGLLHAGFVQHVYPPSDPDQHGDPRRYDLLRDMRTAREEMDKLFAMGEDLWAEWIQDESMLAQTTEERAAVRELCRRSIEEEYGSTKLWTIYGEWMLYLYNSASSADPTQGRWSDQDRIAGREIFTWQSVLDVWRQGAFATLWRIHDSHLVWDRFLDLCLQDLGRSPSAERVEQVRELFGTRLQTPHATWDQTFQVFSGFVSTYYSQNYEEIMTETNARAADAKARYAAREELEARLRAAVESGDRALEWAVYAEYIEWEVTRNRRRRVFSFDLVNAIYQRAVLRFPTDVNLWEDYATFLTQETVHSPHSPLTISTLDRATRHCPWSGSLWSQYLLSSERNGRSFQTIADLKHRATSTGLLDAGGMEEVLKVHTMWCSYLRRRAFLPDATDEDLDVAEVGIRSAIEDVQELGEQKYGKPFQGDPHFRLERIYIRYLSESGSWDSARETFKGLVGRRGNSYEFWLAYYAWELISWSKFVQGDATAHASRRTPNPSYATAVLKQAIKRTDLDWPEKISQVYIAHCEDYEDSEELQIAILETRRAMKAVIARRREQAAKEEAAAAAAAAAAARTADTTASVAGQPVASETVGTTEKRKREDDRETYDSPSSKKPRSVEAATPSTEAEPAVPRRDRENATVVVRNLPRGITEHRVRQFFRHCGTINGVKMFPADGGNSDVAIIEFDSRDEAQVALTRDQKILDENTIEVQVGAGSTLYVTNFPPTADENFIRGLFQEYGKVVDVRFPSLKYNTHRRFCYVQFREAREAQNATKLNGTRMEGNLELVVKISDPSQKQERHGPVYEEREIHVSNIDWKATEDDLREVFSKFGTVESVRIARKVDGGSKGFGFVDFSNKDEANAALSMHQKEFRSRPLQVKLSVPAGAKRMAAAIVNRVGASQSPQPEANGSRAPSVEGEIPTGDRAARTLALMNIPDTVNDARIRSMVEPYGKLIKIVLRPDHRGAIVEFADVNSAGKASLELEGQEIGPDRRIHVGTVPEMLKQSAERKIDRVQSIKHDQPQKERSSGFLPQSGPIKRPTQPGLKGGRRGGLGVKRGGAAGGAAPPTGPTFRENEEGQTSRAVDEKPKKSNDDFRALVERKRND